jgi:CHAD domain-containing protein
VRGELKWVGVTLGMVRDADVLATGLDLSSASQTQPDASSSLRAELVEQRRHAIDHVVEMVNSERYLALLDALDAAAEQPPFLGRLAEKRASRALPKIVKRPVKALRKQVGKVAKHPTDHQLHKIRIRAKQVRYVAEAAVPVVGKKATRLAEAAEALQTQLGKHHDAVVAEAWLGERVQSSSSDVAFEAGRRAVGQQERQIVHRRGWRTTEQVVERRARRWVG